MKYSVKLTPNLQNKLAELASRPPIHNHRYPDDIYIVLDRYSCTFLKVEGKITECRQSKLMNHNLPCVKHNLSEDQCWDMIHTPEFQIDSTQETITIRGRTTRLEFHPIPIRMDGTVPNRGLLTEPYVAQSFRRSKGIGVRLFTESLSIPTQSEPGSPQKIATLRQRYQVGQQLFNPKDRVHEHTMIPPTTGRHKLSQQLAKRKT